MIYSKFNFHDRESFFKQHFYISVYKLGVFCTVDFVIMGLFVFLELEQMVIVQKSIFL